MNSGDWSKLVTHVLIPQPSGRDGGPTSHRERDGGPPLPRVPEHSPTCKAGKNSEQTWAGSLSQERLIPRSVKQTAEGPRPPLPRAPILTAEVSRPPLPRVPTPLHTTPPCRRVLIEPGGPPQIQHTEEHHIRDLERAPRRMIQAGADMEVCLACKYGHVCRWARQQRQESEAPGETRRRPRERRGGGPGRLTVEANPLPRD
uniref:Uncharacterized protein n=1 Tax=Knipowitschia caucasica TaxID=637954 RepID=A0AAV2LHM7_KNICA